METAKIEFNTLTSITQTLYTVIVADSNNMNKPKEIIKVVADDLSAVHKYVSRDNPFNYIVKLTSKQVTYKELEDMDAEQEASNEPFVDMY